LLGRFGVVVEPQPPTLAQRLGLRVTEGALTGVKVSHVLRGGAGEQAGIEAGDELIAAAGWRLRRLDDALRCLGSEAPVALLVSRDQRVVSLELAPASLLGEGAVQLRRAEAAGAKERALCEAWLAA
jgi:predicted metalloprotease with PDZ domain